MVGEPAEGLPVPSWSFDMSSDPILSELFVESFNADLENLGSAARVAPPRPPHSDVLELQDDEGTFLDFIPASASPEMAAIAYRLYGRGLNLGVRAGEAAAWAKLRHLIGAAPSASDI